MSRLTGVISSSLEWVQDSPPAPHTYNELPLVLKR